MMGSYTYLGGYQNLDGSITTYGYIPEQKIFIQKVWRSRTKFEIVAIFKPHVYAGNI